MRITLDANILVRANVRSRGPAREVLDIIRSKPQHILILSRQILAEVEETLKYPRLRQQFGLSDEEISEHVELLRHASSLFEPAVLSQVILNDPDDDAIVYTAIGGRSEVICTRDTHFYAPTVIAFCWERGIQIMNELALLEKLRAEN
jgi:putative PIN family toxin of toxin-antitoxin system